MKTFLKATGMIAGAITSALMFGVVLTIGLIPFAIAFDTLVMKVIGR